MPVEGRLRLFGDAHALGPGVLPEPTDTGRLRGRLLIGVSTLGEGHRRQLPAHEDLVVIDDDRRRSLEPVLGQAACEPGLDPLALLSGGALLGLAGASPPRASSSWECVCVFHDYNITSFAGLSSGQMATTNVAGDRGARGGRTT